MRYEDLVTGTDVRNGLESWLDWPPAGRPDRNLAAIFNRSREVDLHGSAITTHSVGRREDTSDNEMRDLLAWVHREQIEFQRRFGYVP